MLISAVEPEELSSERPFWNWMALRDMGSLVCAYQSMQLIFLARSELGNQEPFYKK